MLTDSTRASNHGTFYYNQLASLQILVGDTDGAKKTLDEYFTGIYLGQISSNGDQVCASQYPFIYVRTDALFQ